MSSRWTALALAFLLSLLGPQPLSACALMMGLPADCAPAAPAESDCEQMPMPVPSAAEGEVPAEEPTEPADPSCCASLAAAVPESNVQVAAADGLLPLAETSDSEVPPNPVAVAPLQAVRPSASPPDRQPLLCVFLI